MVAGRNSADRCDRVPTKFASALAEDYGITKFAADLIAFKHEPDADTAEVADSEAEVRLYHSQPANTKNSKNLSSHLFEQSPLVLPRNVRDLLLLLLHRFRSMLRQELHLTAYPSCRP